MKRRIKPNRDHAPPLIIETIKKPVPSYQANEPTFITLPRIKWLEKDATK